MWPEWRLAAKTATIKLFGGVYETEPALAGRKVACVFDPFGLSAVEVRWNGKPYGLARPQHIGRPSHPKAKPENPAGPPPATGIDYLGIIAAEHDQAARRHRIHYDALAEPGQPALGPPADARHRSLTADPGSRPAQAPPVFADHI